MHIVDVFGTGTGDYTIAIESTAVNGTVISTLILNGTTSQGKLDVHSIELKENYTIIPEFPSFLILALFMIATLVAVIVYRNSYERVDKTRVKLEMKACKLLPF